MEPDDWTMIEDVVEGEAFAARDEAMRSLELYTHEKMHLGGIAGC